MFDHNQYILSKISFWPWNQSVTFIMLTFPPLFRFIGEESVSEGVKCDLTEYPTWIIDPVDGTMNFVHTNPNCCISIGLSINKEIHIGIVYCPSLNLMFTAIKGRGAFLNGKKINVSGEKGN